MATWCVQRTIRRFTAWQSQRMWAPEFIKYEDLFYIYFPTSKGKNYVVTAKDPRGPWSDPVELKVNGVDPGHITDSDGNRFI